MPPVTKHEFGDRFNSCAAPVFCRHHLFRAFCACKDPRGDRKAHSSELLELLPKRLALLDVGSDQREEFFGLYAKPKISGLRILLYHVVCFLPSLGFLFVWLFELGGRRELQDGSMLFSLTAGSVGVFWVAFSVFWKFG